MPRPPRVSTDRILAAAAAEFAARGFGGARVDRIARRARVNKAMLYYHFGSKQALYRTLLRRLFHDAAARMRAIADSPGPAPARLGRAATMIAGFLSEHEHLPRLMLREVADRGAHLDAATLAALAEVPLAFSRLVRRGIDEGALRPVDPLVVYLSMIAPIVVFFAAAPIRRRLSARQLLPATRLDAERFVREVQETIGRAILERPR